MNVSRDEEQARTAALALASLSRGAYLAAHHSHTPTLPRTHTHTNADRIVTVFVETEMDQEGSGRGRGRTRARVGVGASVVAVEGGGARRKGLGSSFFSAQVNILESQIHSDFHIRK